MKKTLILFSAGLVLGFVFSRAEGQSPPEDMDEVTRQSNAQRIATNKAGMLVLGGWALTNIGVGTAGYLLSEDDEWRCFHQMNAGWNIVNLAIATFGYLGEAGKEPSGFNWLETIQEGEFMQKALLLNAGLDVGYMALGGLLWQKGHSEDSPRFVGYGQSLIVQGAFLMVFDLTLFALNHRISADYMMMLSPNENGGQISVLGTF